MSIDQSVWVPIATLLLGYVASLVTEWFRDSRAARREASVESRRESESRRLQSIAFQRETLLELQELVQRRARSAGAVYMYLRREAEKDGRWGPRPLSDVLNDEDLQSNARLILVESRVLDDDLRELIHTFRSRVNALNVASTREESGLIATEVAGMLPEIHARIGELLRERLI